MSAYVEVKTQIKDQEALVEALLEMRNKVGRPWTRDDIEIHEEAQPLVGYMGKVRRQKANIIIRRKNVGGSANDIGFERTEDGTFVAHISDFDKHFHNEQWRQELNVEYGTKFVEKKAKAKGYRMKKEVQADGSVKIKLSRWR
jgi:hypothetical protein